MNLSVINKPFQILDSSNIHRICLKSEMLMSSSLYKWLYSIGANS